MSLISSFSWLLSCKSRTTRRSWILLRPRSPATRARLACKLLLCEAAPPRSHCVAAMDTRSTVLLNHPSLMSLQKPDLHALLWHVQPAQDQARAAACSSPAALCQVSLVPEPALPPTPSITAASPREHLPIQALCMPSFGAALQQSRRSIGSLYTKPGTRKATCCLYQRLGKGLACSTSSDMYRSEARPCLLPVPWATCGVNIQKKCKMVPSFQGWCWLQAVHVSSPCAHA